MLQALADGIAAGLCVPGGFLRELMLWIPLPAVRIIFILVPVLLLIWVFTLDRRELCGQIHGARKPVNLRPFAIAALVIQILLYATF